MSGGEAWGLHNFKRWKFYLKFTRAWVWLSYGCHHRLENMLLQPRGQTSQEFAHLEHFSKETWRITPHPSIDCNLRCYCGKPRVTSSFPSIIQSLPHHLLLSHLCQAPGSNQQCLFSVAEMASIRVHVFLSSSDPELIQTHPSNLLMTNLPRTSLIIAKEVSLFTYRFKLFLRNFPPWPCHSSQSSSRVLPQLHKIKSKSGREL